MPGSRIIEEADSLLADGPTVSHTSSRHWRFHGAALIAGLCMLAALVYVGRRPSFSAPERGQAVSQEKPGTRQMNLDAVGGLLVAGQQPPPTILTANAAAPTLLQADPPNSLLKKAAAMEKSNPAGPSPLEKEYVLAQHANPKEKEASEQEKAPGPPDAGPLKKKDAEESKSKSCKTATPGDTCYKAVLWAKWIGLIEHPTWYPGLKRATANRMAIQEWLHNNSQGDCHRPCDHETYPIPPSGKGKPSLFCFSVARMGPEMDTMFMQRQMGAGIFACDGHAVYSDTHVNIDGFKTTLIPSTASGVSTDKTAANSQVFMNTWNNLLTTTKWYEYDFIAKVDPDCVFFPARLRGHVHSYVGQNVFFLNCGKYVPATMYGALEVYSKSSLGAYLSAHPRCETSFPFGAWGEDKYMTNCLEMLGCKSVVDFGNFLHDERCWGVDCGNKQAVAFHAFKQVNQWYNCWLLSNHHGF